MVRPGCRFGAFDQYGPGDIVAMTEQEAAGFSDKLAVYLDPASPPSLPKSMSQPAPGQALGGLPAQVVEALARAGLDTVARVRAASDTALLALPGVGRATLRKIREATAPADG